MGIARSRTAHDSRWESDARMQRYLLVALTVLVGVAGWLGYRAEQDRKAAVERVARLESELAKRGVVVPPVESVA